MGTMLSSSLMLGEAWNDALEAVAALPYPDYATGPGAHWLLDARQQCHNRWEVEAYQAIDGDWAAIVAEGPTLIEALLSLIAQIRAR